jgi:hypothetical protein
MTIDVERANGETVFRRLRNEWVVLALLTALVALEGGARRVSMGMVRERVQSGRRRIGMAWEWVARRLGRRGAEECSGDVEGRLVDVD